MSNNVSSIINGELIIKSRTNGEIIWNGRLKDLNVQEVISIPDTEDFIVLLECLKAAILYNKKNLLRITSYGKTVWEVGPPEIITSIGFERPVLEIYSGIVGLQRNVLQAYGMSGFVDDIDLETGKIKKSVFIK